MAFKPVVWSMQELADATKERIKNRFDAIMVITGFTGVGKCQPAGSKVLMANGIWKSIEDVKVGDLILSPQKDGSHIFAKVTNLSNWFCKNVYEIKQVNKNHKRLYSCSGNHTIPFYDRYIPREEGIRYSKNAKWKYREKTAEEFSKFGKGTLGHKRVGFSSFKIDKYLGRYNCEIEPYTLGVWLGDGHFSSKKELNKNFNKTIFIKSHYRHYPSGKIVFQPDMNKTLKNNSIKICYRGIGITSNSFEVMEEVSKFYPIMHISKKQNTTCKTYMFSLNGELAKQLIKYGLEGKNSGTKFIPKEALLSDYDYRIKLLAGLIDTDGYYKNGSYRFTLKSKKLIEDIKALTYSLGGRTNEIKEVKKKSQNGTEGIYYSIILYFCDTKIPLKVDYKIKNISSVYLASNRIGIESKKANSSMVYGFSIQSPSHWYITDNWMITHNSSFIWKFFHKFPDFKVKEKLTFEREEMIHLIKDFKNSYVFADELISSVNKRKFYDQEQIELIEILTKYRNNFNILAGAVPIFFSLDKELLKLIGIHINIPERGLAIIHLPKKGRMFVDDLWDIRTNQKLEEKWSKAKQKNPNFKIPYWKYTTFAGFLPFGKLSPRAEKLYEKLKAEKRAKAEGLMNKEEPKGDFYSKIMGLLKEEKLDEPLLLQLCLFDGKKISNVKVRLNQMLKDKGTGKTVRDFLKQKKENINNTNYLYNNTIERLSSLEPPNPKSE